MTLEPLAELVNDQAVTVRQLAPSEWEANKRLRLEALEREPQAFGTSYSEAAQKSDTYWQQRLEQVEVGQGSWMLFALKAGVCIGMAGAYTTGVGKVDIISVYVTGRERGRGISRMLMEALTQQISEDPSVEVMSLTVNRDQSAAVALYTALGFVIVGETSSEMGDGRIHDEYMMQKS
jgi:ribosomal protein S18 acetylase RimI-like enzyme